MTTKDFGRPIEYWYSNDQGYSFVIVTGYNGRIEKYDANGYWAI